MSEQSHNSEESLLSDGFTPNQVLTNFLHAIVDDFESELRNTADYSARRKSHELSIAKLIEAKIASGELMVRKMAKVKWNDSGEFGRCECGAGVRGNCQYADNFCPGRGTKII